MHLRGDDIEIVVDPRPFDSISDVISRFRSAKYADLIVVGPYPVLDKLATVHGIRPLWAQVRPASMKEQPDMTFRNRPYVFEGFKRLERVNLEFSEPILGDWKKK